MSTPDAGPTFNEEVARWWRANPPPPLHEFRWAPGAHPWVWSALSSLYVRPIVNPLPPV